MKFFIVCSGFNCEKYVLKCINSVRNQTYKNFDYVFIDDCSFDKTRQILSENLPAEKIIFNKRRIGTVKSHHEGIQRAGENDIIVWLDMDDSLKTTALERVSLEYEDENTWLTYGNFIDKDGLVCLSKDNVDYSDKTHNKRDYRKEEWKFIHPRTFKKKLYDKLTDDDLFMPTNINAYVDFNLWMCLLEMSGKEHIRAITDVLYVYNNMNPMNLLRAFSPCQLMQELKHLKAIPPKLPVHAV